MTLTFIKILPIFIFAATSSNPKFDIYGRPKCCSDTLAPSYQRLQPWTDSLRAATYQSIIRHLDFSGSLDGRLDRDERLWGYLQEANFITDKNSSFDDLFEETKSGILIERPQNNQRATYEFQETEKSGFDCPNNNCYSFNNSLIALWRVRKSDSSGSMWIRVKLPKISNNPIEDMYYYSAKFGLKKLSPDPAQLHHHKNHRFSPLPKKKNELKYLDRVDFHFPHLKNIYSTGRVTPTSFLYDSPVYPDSGEDWYPYPKKPYSESIFEPGGRHRSPSSSGYGLSRPWGTSRPLHEYDHFHHANPSIPPSQELDHPSQEVRGFMPAVGPIDAPPPYRTEYAYDPRYLMYYTNEQNPTHQDTPPPRFFKPSTEYVRYSELDPFFHPDGQDGSPATSPMPFDTYKPKFKFSTSISDQLPTKPTEEAKPFQIIVGNTNSQLHTPTKPTQIDKLPPITVPTRSKLLPITQSTVAERTRAEDEIAVKAFGEKIKPKTTTTTKPTTSTTKPVIKVKPATTIDYKTQTTEMGKEEDEKTITTEELHTNPIHEEMLTSTSPANGFDPKSETELITNATQSLPSTSTTEEFTESTEGVDKTTFETTSFDTTQKFTNENKMTIITSVQFAVPKDESTIMSTKTTEDLSTPQNFDVTTDLEPTTQTELNTMKDGSTDEITMKNTMATDSTRETDDFFSSLANLFSTDTTTEMPNESTTMGSTEKNTLNDPETQESQIHNINYRLLTFPGDPVSIVANRISKTVSFRTSAGKERKLHNKYSLENFFRFPNKYKDYHGIL